MNHHYMPEIALRAYRGAVLMIQLHFEMSQSTSHWCGPHKICIEEMEVSQTTATVTFSANVEGRGHNKLSIKMSSPGKPLLWH